VTTITTFSPTAGVVSAQGLDVSNFQGQFNWAAAKSAEPALAFGIYRLTEGLPADADNSPDPTAVHNAAGIRAQGLAHGAYHFLHPRDSGAAQAQYFVQQHMKIGLSSDDMLWLDNESTDGMNPAAVAASARAFMAELKILAPHNPMGVYTYINFASNGNCAGLGAYPLWLAYPNLASPTPPPPWANWTFWQWGSRNGIDADAFNGTAAQLHAWIASFAPAAATGPYRHVLHSRSLAQMAAARSTTPKHLLSVTAGAYTAKDAATVVDGMIVYTTNP
jgi:GH25 family lysozyme M1 (1,4-beta-N-acetylmuramidase)